MQAALDKDAQEKKKKEDAKKKLLVPKKLPLKDKSLLSISSRAQKKFSAKKSIVKAPIKKLVKPAPSLTKKKPNVQTLAQKL